MAGQRTGRSRFGFKMVLFAVLWCALHLKDLKAYQTLAVPGSGAPNKAELKKLTVTQLREKLREKGKAVSGNKTALIERLMQDMPLETGARGEKRLIPKAMEPANSVTDVFVPLEGTIQKLEELLEEERVVFIWGGVATGKSTLAKHLSRTRPSKYLPVHPPKTKKALSEESWANELRETLLQDSSTADVANRSLKHIFQRLFENDQVLIFDECHMLFSCPVFCQLLVTKPSHLRERLKVLMLFTVSEAKNEQGEIHTAPVQITAKYMWTPPIPLASQLVDQLAAANVHLTEDAIDFFMCLCAGHPSIFMRTMQWVQERQKQEKNSALWDIGRSLGEVRTSWEVGFADWVTDKQGTLMETLKQSPAICVNGKNNANNIPDEFVEIVCQGVSGGLKPAVCCDLIIHGLILPSAEKHQEFEPCDWNVVGARYGVSNPLLAAYYCKVLEKTRHLIVDVHREVTSCIDLLLRALPYLNFLRVGGCPVGTTYELSAEGLPYRAAYVRAIVHVLQDLGFRGATRQVPARFKVDIYCKQGGTKFAFEAVMARSSPTRIAKVRSRFDTKPVLQADKKCLVIIGKLDRVRKLVPEVQGGIEVVGLVPNAGHVGYTICVKQGEGVVEFNIECDQVAKKLTSLSKKPYFEAAQKLKFIRPGWVAAAELTDIHVPSFHGANCSWSIAVSLTFALLPARCY